MPRPKKRTPKVEEVRPYLEGVANNLVDKLYGRDGPPWGTRLTEIEDLLLAVREVLTQKMLADALARQAAHPPAAALTCPGCRQPLACAASNDRILQTQVGEAQWAEPEAYCPRCRRAFFPSVPEPGHGPVRGQPGHAAEDHSCRDGQRLVLPGQ
jgi:hypothetical protein